MSDRIKKPLSLPAVPPTKIAQGQQATGEREAHDFCLCTECKTNFPVAVGTKSIKCPKCGKALLLVRAAQQPTDGAQRQLINSWRELADSADLYAKESKKANYPAEKIVKHATTAYDLNKCASELEGTLVAIESVSKLQSSSKAFEREVQGPTSPTLREAVIQECCKILLDNGEHRAEWILLRALAAQPTQQFAIRDSRIPNMDNTDGALRKLAQSWPHEKELVIPSSVGGFDVRTDDWTAPDLGYQVCTSDCRRCQLERALAAQASSDPLDKPSGD